jgi:hypothetical protein
MEGYWSVVIYCDICQKYVRFLEGSIMYLEGTCMYIKT